MNARWAIIRGCLPLCCIRPMRWFPLDTIWPMPISGSLSIRRSVPPTGERRRRWISACTIRNGAGIGKRPYVSRICSTPHWPFWMTGACCSGLPILMRRNCRGPILGLLMTWPTIIMGTVSICLLSQRMKPIVFSGSPGCICRRWQERRQQAVCRPWEMRARTISALRCCAARNPAGSSGSRFRQCCGMAPTAMPMGILM